MNKRALTLLISAALFGAAGSAVAQSTDTYERGAPPPVSEAAVPPPVDPTLADADEADDVFVTGDDPLDTDAPQVRTQSPPNDPTLASRLDDDADVDVDVHSEGRVAIDEGEDRALADADYDGTLEGDADVDVDIDAGAASDVASDDVPRSAGVTGPAQDPVDYAEQPIAANDLDSADGQTPDVTESEGTPFAETAGTEGFSEGQTASLAEQRFSKLDSDGDGTLGEDEIAAAEGLSDRSKDYDINGDGMIAQNEFQSWFAAQNWLEGDDARDSGLAATEQDDFVDETDIDTTDDADLDADADIDVDVDSDLDSDLDSDD